MNRLKVAILFGGRSAEHEVSLQSAKNVIDAIDRNRYDVVPIGIDKEGQWLLHDGLDFLCNADNPRTIKINTDHCRQVAFGTSGGGILYGTSNCAPIDKIDVVFPLLHGPYGEDGTLQGLLKLAGVPFVGAGVLGSAIGMDKDVTKRLLRDAGLPIGKFKAVYRQDEVDVEQILLELEYPVFVKPANLGSSVGVSKAQNKEELEKAIEIAFGYDGKILIESFVDGREIECAVLGNQHPTASVVGEVVPHHNFYSYEAKYLDVNGATPIVPAAIDQATSDRVRDLSIRVFKALCCEGLARVDFFLQRNGDILINEINTIPGFTNISMYPRLWQASGMSYSDLINQLIELSIERFNRERYI